MTVSELLEGFPCQTSAGEEGWLMQVKLELHRNIRGMRFPSACGQQEKRRASQVVKNAMDQRNSSETDKMDCLGLAGLSENERELLADKGWLPAGESLQTGYLWTNQHADTGAFVGGRDHLCLEFLQNHSDTDALWRKASFLDSQLGSFIDYAFDKEFGYLTASPALAGTGMKLSALLYLPGLAERQFLSELRDAAARGGFSLRRAGESDSAAPYFRLENTVTLGVSEAALAERMTGLLKDIGKAENRARDLLLHEQEMLMKDRIWRALGVLKYARLIGKEETERCAGLVQLGMEINMFPKKENLFRNLLGTASPAFVREKTHNENLDEEGVRLWRAVLLRELVNAVGL